MKNGRHLTLGIETSCDETAVSVVADGRDILSNVISTQISIHTQFGGVVPEIASRRHLENINGVIDKALTDAGVCIGDIDLVGVTYGPGLVGALLIGVAAAKSIAYACDIPLVGVNHMHGHIAANYLEHHDLEPPFMSLVVSGGHTNIVNVPDYNRCEKIGGTRDDAAGEAFDKVARVIGLGYPGGPKVDKAAREGRRDAIDFKRVWLEPGSYDFSFSGLKTQALNYLNSERQAGREINVNDVAASFQEAVVEVIAEKAVRAAAEYGQKRIVMAGGVASNTRLRELISEKAAAEGIDVLRPSPVLCTDNGAMIASAAYYAYKAGERSGYDLDAVPALEF
ncbi:MAG: tRNA (adenosine(37)-N6)-threonylcarbamoyltransferase complex transferase subunit TsaD [Mogibacterium sp.]|jgi:N6-L-threonylcarbamoyladenine synthase|nr:tRNA (adenosine(37)-N6)-threonylcarbamoyltransferase complex transferase subunit TsaD [Mogibacterium sp.]